MNGHRCCLRRRRRQFLPFASALSITTKLYNASFAERVPNILFCFQMKGCAFFQVNCDYIQ